MPRIERKYIKNRAFFYLTRRVRAGKKYKKIQVYLGKRVPKELEGAYQRLRGKEEHLISEMLSGYMLPDTRITREEYASLERSRIRLAYALAALSDKKREILWRRFAIRFIFESNAIEGSRLSQAEVAAIVNNSYVKKKLARVEVQEAENAIEAFEHVRSSAFRLNQRSIIALHALITHDLTVRRGYKRMRIVVNNKETTPPGKVRPEMAKLLTWWKAEKRRAHPFFAALIFHQRFERTHPFEDGNGRVGRMILIWMLMQAGYHAILFRNKNRRAYFAALHDADEGRPRAWLRQGIAVYRKTVALIAGAE